MSMKPGAVKITMREQNVDTKHKRMLKLVTTRPVCGGGAEWWEEREGVDAAMP